MKVEKNIIYSINLDDVRKVSQETLDRDLTLSEINMIKGSIGNHIDWYRAIENAIHESIHK